MTSLITPSKPVIEKLPESMTEGQIDRAVAMYRAALRERPGDFMTGLALTVFGQEFARWQVPAVYSQTEDTKRKVHALRISGIDRTRSIQNVLDATGFDQKHVDPRVAEAMPLGMGESIEIVFFTLGFHLPLNHLEAEYEQRGLDFVDPYSLAVANEVGPRLASGRSNVTYWKDARYKWCEAAFHISWQGPPWMAIFHPCMSYVSGDMWLAGVAKKTQS